ncbi:HEPN domain-containing protein [Nocardia sp. NPDC004722]
MTSKGSKEGPHSGAWFIFQRNWTTIDHLIDVRLNSRSNIPRPARASLNIAAVVFIVTAWEAYVEDLVDDAASQLGMDIESFDELPNRVKSVISEGIRKNPPTWNPANIVEDGWRDVVYDNAHRRIKGGAFNTPKAENVDRLFYDTIGMKCVSDSWHWQGVKHGEPAKLLNRTIEIRGAIVHRGRHTRPLELQMVRRFGANVKKLVECTENAVNNYKVLITGKPLDDFTKSAADGTFIGKY